MDAAVAEYDRLLSIPEGDDWLLAELGRQDLFFLLAQTLRRADLKHPWLYARCREVEKSPDGQLDLWAREHYKSTIITFGLTIQDILRDPDETFGIFSHTRPIAKAFLRQIKLEFEGNEELKALYPDVLWQAPKKDSPKWSEDEGIVVRRKGNPKEATVEAWGLVDGMPTSKHFGKLIYDDVVTKESVNTPEMIEKTTQALELSYSLGAEGGAQRFVGTRYHFNDTYRTVIDRKTAVARVYPATENGQATGKPVLLSRESLAKKRRDMGIYTFGCQMMQNPRADATHGFKREWLEHWTPDDGAGLNKYLLVDPANSKKDQADYTSIWVLGLGPDENFYILDMIRDRLNLTERADRVFTLHRKWRPIETRYEEYGLQADVDHIRTEQDKRKYRFKITTVGGKVRKEERIKRLVPVFEAHRIILPHALHSTVTDGETRDLVHDFIEDEYMPFPVPAHDDMLDCLARILEPTAIGGEKLTLKWPAKLKPTPVIESFGQAVEGVM
jgi:predicted phage terminase large subunit-like protein